MALSASGRKTEHCDNELPELSQELRYELGGCHLPNKSHLPDSALSFVNLYKEFDADDDELTRTRKLRRGFLKSTKRSLSPYTTRAPNTFTWIPRLL
jgi:hypothetical protein